MRLTELTVTLSFAIVSAKGLQSSFKCSNIQADGYRYDLSALNKEWLITGRIPLRFNPCGPIDYFNDACPHGSTYMCAMDPSNSSTGRANIGVPTDMYRNSKGELVVLYSHGDFDMNGFPYISLVRFECDPNSKETGPVEPVSDGSKYFLIWKTRAACSTGGSGSTTIGFFWVLLAGLGSYFAGGTIFNVAVRGKSGKEAIPHYWLLADVGEFLVELFGNIRARLFGSRGGYQRI